MQRAIRLRLVATLAATFVAGALALNAAAAPPPRAEQGSPEPHGFVEPCTVGNVQEMHTECELCSLSAADSCQERFGERGYSKKCSTRAVHGSAAEVWCRDRRTTKSTAQNPGVLLALGLSIALGVFVVLKRTQAQRRRPK